MTSARVSMLRCRPAWRSAGAILPRCQPGRSAGVGALASTANVSRSASSSKVSSAAGKYSRSDDRSRFVARVRSQIRCLMGSGEHLDTLRDSAVTGDLAVVVRSVRTSSASIFASPGSDFAPDTVCRSR
jgi:hypothetical protein